MKQVYKVGTKQYFTYFEPKLFKKNRRVENHWVIRNVKYVYAETEEEAVSKYRETFYKPYHYITHGWGNWFSWDDGASIDMFEKFISIKEEEICVIDNKTSSEKYEDYLKNMTAEDFKEWWFSKEVKTYGRT